MPYASGSHEAPRSWFQRPPSLGGVEVSHEPVDEHRLLVQCAWSASGYACGMGRRKASRREPPAEASAQRIIIIGTSGSGKTTLAAAVAARLGIRHVEIDALYHGPDWVPRDTFLRDVTNVAAGDSWVAEWQYPEARPVLLDRATLAVWLDYPVSLRIWRVTRRALRRRIRRIELWNGNYEPSLWTFFTDRDHIIRWAWRTRHQYDDLVMALSQSHPEVRLVRLTSQDETDAWMRGLSGT